VLAAAEKHEHDALILTFFEPHHLHTTLRAGQTCLAPLLRTAFRPDMINLINVGIHEYTYVIASTLCVGIVVSAPFLRWPCTDRLLSTALHNASVDEASNLDKTSKLF
jgi:hypothetical protein